MGRFDDILTATASKFTAAFGETVTLITPAGVERAVTAVVDRSPIGDLGGGMGLSWDMEIEFINSGTTGLAASEFDGNQWQVKVPVRIGEAVKTRTISHILSQDAGMIRVAVK